MRFKSNSEERRKEEKTANKSLHIACGLATSTKMLNFNLEVVIRD